MSSYGKPPVPSGKKPYEPPKLTVFGPLSKLTQAGTGAISENNGKKDCGVAFNTKGGSNC
jgi:hypothetical protein